MKEQILNTFNAHRNDLERLIVDVTTRLVACKTVNAGKDRLHEFDYLEVPGQERKAADVVAEYLDQFEIPYAIHEGAPLRANIIANLFSGDPVLMVGCHLDTVPPGDESKWNTPPFEVVEEDGKLYGRGVLDNLGPMAASLAAARLLQLSGVTLNGTFQLAGLASEEFREPGEEDPGIEYLLNNKLIAPDMAIIPDIGEQMKFIDIAEKGRMVLKIVTTGKQAHGSTPDRGINAVNMMARILTAVEALELPHEVHPVLGKPSKNLGILRGGEAANIVPASCTAELDVRIVPGQTPEAIRDLVLKTSLDVIRPDMIEEGIGVTIEINDATIPHAMPADHPLVKSIQESVSQAAGFTPEPFGIGGGTFAKAFNLGGIPAVGFGPGRDDQFHVVNEHIELSELVQFSLVCALIASDLLG
jgi:succinyl-diaminopimelate desuccinylase